MNPELQRWSRIGLVCGVLGLAATGLGMVFRPTPFFAAYLWALLFAIGLSMGSACMTMIHHLSRGYWGFLIRRTLEAAMAPMPWLALLFLPLFLGLNALYPWSDPLIVARDPVLAHRAPYMSAAGYILRTVAYLALWSWITVRLHLLSGEQTATNDPEPYWKLRRFSAFGLVAYPVVATLALLDWVISLDAHWYSSMFAALACVGQLLAGYSLALMLMPLLARLEPKLFHERVLNQLGNLLLALTILWAYLAFSQFLIIWSGNLPQENHWYLRRVAGGWRWLIGLVSVFHFAVPLAILLSRAAKRRLRVLQATAALLLVSQLAYQFWVVLPSVSVSGADLLLGTAAVLLGVGGIWLWLFAAALGSRPIFGFTNGTA